jgi:hypothetical protein
VIVCAKPLSLDWRTERLVAVYMTAKESVIEAGFAAEIDWQHQLDFDAVTEQDFLRESAWVIFSSGMREAVVRAKFSAISTAFLHWESAQAVVRHSKRCRQSALSVFAHEGKVEAVLSLAEAVTQAGFEHVRRRIKEQGVAYLQCFPYLGPATSYHLAKNLGLNVVKPDRHLRRIAKQAGYPSPGAMCRKIAEVVGDKDSVVDLVLWRYATQNRKYLTTFTLQAFSAIL